MQFPLAEKTVDTYCGHCGHAAMLPVLHLTADDEPSKDGMGTHTLTRTFMCRCPGCEGFLLFSRRYVITDLIDQNWTSHEWEPLYPTEGEIPAELPLAVAKAYRTALRCQHVDANAFATMLGRVLDVICKDKNAPGDRLVERLESIASSEQLPTRLKDSLHALRKLRNVGAHADLGDLSEDDGPVLAGLCRALIEYLYVGPDLLAKAEAAFGKLKVTKQKRPPP